MKGSKSKDNSTNGRLEAKAKALEVAPKLKSKRIDVKDAEAIAQLTAKGLNEAEACAMIGLRRESWYNWKSDHKADFEELFTQVRGNRLKNLLHEIETAAKGDASRNIRHDWRAADRLLAISAPERFAKAPEQAASLGNGWTVIVNSIAPELAKRAFAEVLDAETVPAALPSGSASQPALPAPADKPLV
jgi:hypothetical protein